ncbi:PREDICTED: uncharacterized protein LOC109485563 [Branchiostoma belcheri]|uniref:Uncharacterized protein LOC109485563 n=1 Tax=Branchiostoma belcheri TaxID=7741 RepID=A0A6P4ZUF7_BRABE|nr:PREDICTED: uncharacterized protein LOC109485563 [Branchiostoma belcheri]
MAGNTGADLGESLVPYDSERQTQVVQHLPPGGLPLVPYIGPPVVYKVYNITNPVGIQIESHGSYMAVEDPSKTLKDDQRRYTETGTQTDQNSENAKEPIYKEDEGDWTAKLGLKTEQPKSSNSNWTYKGIPEHPPFIVLQSMPKLGSCKRVDNISQRIVTRMELLQGQGNWDMYDKFLMATMKHFKDDPDILVRVVLEDVVGAYFRDDLQSGYTSLQRAEELVQKVSDPAQQQTHRLFLKSALLRKEKRHDEADNVNYLALQGLPYMKPGRDTASVWYNLAALKAQVLYECENPPTVAKALYQEAVAAFEAAIENYKFGLDKEERTCKNSLRRSHVRLSMALVGSCSLQEVENSLWEGITSRMRCSWYLAKSDLFRRRGNTQRATEMAQEALRVARNGDFPSEVKFAEVRLGLLKREEIQVEEDMAWLWSDESTGVNINIDKVWLELFWN